MFKHCLSFHHQVSLLYFSSQLFPPRMAHLCPRSLITPSSVFKFYNSRGKKTIDHRSIIQFIVSLYPVQFYDFLPSLLEQIVLIGFNSVSSCYVSQLNKKWSHLLSYVIYHLRGSSIMNPCTSDFHVIAIIYMT